MVMSSVHLDDRTYADLVEEARAMIPSLYPDWTNHNPSDPGITLIELFAWLVEMLLYRVNVVPRASYWTFLKLLNGSARLPTEAADLDAAIRTTILGLRERYRAVTCADYEDLAVRGWAASAEAAALGSAGSVRRALCLAGRNLELPSAAARGQQRQAHVSLIVVPDAALGDGEPQPTPALRLALHDWLEPRRLLTVVQHVTGPEYVRVTITARLLRYEGTSDLALRTAARDAVRRFFHPVLGGPDGVGWQFGRDVYVSEVYDVLARVPGVVHVSDVVLATVGSSGTIGADRSIRLEAHQLVGVRVDEQSFTSDVLAPGTS